MRERPNTGTGWRKLVLGPGVGNLDTFPLSIACALRFLTQFCFSWLPLAKFWRYIPIFHNHFDFAIVDSTTKSKPFLLWVWRDVRSNKWKKLRLLDWPRTMAWARLGYTRSSPQSKHKIGNPNFCQTRFGPNFDFYAAARVSQLSAAEHWPLRWVCLVSPNTLACSNTYLFPLSGKLESP